MPELKKIELWESIDNRHDDYRFTWIGHEIDSMGRKINSIINTINSLVEIELKREVEKK